jgi:hypothetical protein
MNLKHLLVSTLILFSCQAYSQTQLYGTWTAHCSFENGNQKSMTTSSLCPVKQTSDSSVTISSIQLKVDATHLTFGEDKTGITYVKRSNNNAISFVKDRTPYSFDILGTTSSKYLILRGHNGQMLLLEKTED